MKTKKIIKGLTEAASLKEIAELDAPYNPYDDPDKTEAYNEAIRDVLEIIKK